jgi:hypothetical protein
MNFDAFKANIADMIKEFELKIGSADSSVGVYYTKDSLKSLLDADEDEIPRKLELFCDEVKDTFGSIKVSRDGERYCLTVPKSGAEYVQKNYPDSEFLKEFIPFMGAHHENVSIDDVLEIFHRYSDSVKCLPSEDSDEFDYLVYFENGIPDSYRYFIQLEGCHAVYHRFTLADYENFISK